MAAGSGEHATRGRHPSVRLPTSVSPSASVRLFASVRPSCRRLLWSSDLTALAGGRAGGWRRCTLNVSNRQKRRKEVTKAAKAASAPAPARPTARPRPWRASVGPAVVHPRPLIRFLKLVVRSLARPSVRPRPSVRQSRTRAEVSRWTGSGSGSGRPLSSLSVRARAASVLPLGVLYCCCCKNITIIKTIKKEERRERKRGRKEGRIGGTEGGREGEGKVLSDHFPALPSICGLPLLSEGNRSLARSLGVFGGEPSFCAPIRVWRSWRWVTLSLITATNEGQLSV